ncbi:sucrose phosphorylase [Pseudonocardia bannensis]|uniref:Sucrose phosphorylase n=1 Tax=Pseudonocardia bannensis TaxID=630973 RepID=A0A848DET3_9PSEU|nr:sucrose phosphorylase [Pseudonocardia bannensis]NMH91073.1 sucrose phosphorylase [Pseudonocardia bannensis]
MRNQVQLVAYADRLGGSLPGLARLLDGPLAGLFGGVHVLPFYLPYDGADAGFDPIDHLAVDPRLGGWEDVRRLAASRDVVADLIVNHVSDRSVQFRDVVEHGEQSPYAGMFLTYDRVFPHGATEADLVRIVRPRPGLPFTPAVLGGRRRLAWTTFTSHQIDLDVHHPVARRYLSAVLRQLADCGIAMVRLDAVGYAVKTAGSACFMTPETVEFIVDIAAEARRLGLEVLAEVHAPHRYTVQAAGRVDRVYDFVLAPLILHAVFTGDSRPLRDWLTRRPGNSVTVLDTHDGIGMIDAGPGPDTADGGLLTATQLDSLVATISRNSGGTSRASTVRGGGGGVYQVSCTAYDAVGRDDRRYLLARLLQLFTPGIPQIYYVGLLAGDNEPGLAGRTGDAREINRRSYTEAEVGEALRRPVVRALTRLIRLRTTHPAFGGEFTLLDTPAGELTMVWRAGRARARLRTSLADASYRLAFTADGAEQTITGARLIELT